MVSVDTFVLGIFVMELAAGAAGVRG